MFTVLTNVAITESVIIQLKIVSEVLCLFLEPVINVTSCFLINLCDLCGSNPPRGICIPANKESRCECLPNKNDPSRPYSGEFCLASASQLTTPTIPSRWTPVIIGIVAGIAGLLFTITLCLWAIAIWRGRRNEK